MNKIACDYQTRKVYRDGSILWFNSISMERNTFIPIFKV